MMRIPFVPITQGGGNFGPTQSKFLDYYATPRVAVSHKAFQNLPMNTEAPPVLVPPAGAKNGSKVRVHDTGVGYSDRFKADLIPGNFKKIFADLEEARKKKEIAIAVSRMQYPTLYDIINSGYRNLGRNQDAEHENSVRDRLRQSGASDEEIEIILKEARMKKLRELTTRVDSPEEREILRLERQLGLRREEAQQQMSARGFTFDGNVYNFGTPAPIDAHLNNLQAEPGNEIFAGAASAGVNPAGPPFPEVRRIRPRIRGTQPLPQGSTAIPMGQLPLEAFFARRV